MNLHRRLEWALDEDLGPGDVTTEATIPADRMGSAVIVAKSPGVVSGLAAVKATFDIVSRRSGGFVSVRPMVSDGQWVNAGDEVVRLSGSLPSVLMGERVALNLLMRMTGIATHVASILREVGPTTFVAVDTRKTTPLWRDLEKAAVRHGGGGNHRFGLFDGILIKENHILAAGGLSQAVEAAKKSAHHLLKVEVEVETLDELAEALDDLGGPAPDHLRGDVAAGDARAPGGEHHLHRRVLQPLDQLAIDGGHIVGDQAARHQLMPSIAHPLHQGVTRAVVGQGARVGDGEHRDAHRNEDPALVDPHLSPRWVQAGSTWTGAPASSRACLRSDAGTWDAW